MLRLLPLQISCFSLAGLRFFLLTASTLPLSSASRFTKRRGWMLHWLSASDDGFASYQRRRLCRSGRGPVGVVRIRAGPWLEAVAAFVALVASPPCPYDR
ncbi:hypothetical protein AKJ16_DCAP09803 [Drosera capensis]